MFVTVRQKTEYNSAKEASYGRLFLLAFAEHRAAALRSLAPEARDQGRQVREQERHEGEQEDGQESGRVTKTERSPSLMESARRNCASIRGPRITPSITGPTGKSYRRMKKPRIPMAYITRRSMALFERL
jgi:hypothetical protein